MAVPEIVYVVYNPFIDFADIRNFLKFAYYLSQLQESFLHFFLKFCVLVYYIIYYNLYNVVFCGLPPVTKCSSDFFHSRTVHPHIIKHFILSNWIHN
jgi:hypothetical protein